MLVHQRVVEIPLLLCPLQESLLATLGSPRTIRQAEGAPAAVSPRGDVRHSAGDGWPIVTTLW